MIFKYTYVVTLKNDRAKAINLISLWISLLSAGAFLSQVITVQRNYIFLIGFLFVAAGLSWNLYQKKVRNERVFYSRILLVAGFIWIGFPSFPLNLIGFPIILLGLFEKQVKLPLEIGFTDDRIVVNTLFRKKFTWQDFNNIMLKDGMLTLDFKNNTLFQKETIDEGDNTGEEEFNVYCSLKLGLADGRPAVY